MKHPDAFRTANAGHSACAVCPGVTEKLDFFHQPKERIDYLFITKNNEESEQLLEILKESGLADFSAISESVRCVFPPSQSEAEYNLAVSVCGIWTRMLLHSTDVINVITCEEALAQINASGSLEPFQVKHHPAYGLTGYLPFNTDGLATKTFLSDLKNRT